MSAPVEGSDRSASGEVGATYEYKWVSIEQSGAPASDMLNRWGREGWRLVPGVERFLGRMLMERVQDGGPT